MVNQVDKKRRAKVSARLFRSSGKMTTLDRVVRQFKELLKNGDIRPGDRIPNETELAKSFGASRGSIREAIKALVSYGVLEVKWGEGTYVRESIGGDVFDHQLFQLLVSEKDHRHLFELREIMEFGTARLAVTNASDEDLEKIETVLREEKTLIDNGTTDPEILAEVDARFHLAVGRAAHNPLIEKIYTFAMELYFPSILNTQANRKTEEQLREPIGAHQAILDALRTRDRKTVAEAVRLSLANWLLNVP